jgi:hypothetical protein
MTEQRTHRFPGGLGALAKCRMRDSEFDLQACLMSNPASQGAVICGGMPPKGW